ncbi:unnamed protein product [Ambrosiozyma monospora]|uniref:Unnamed protein product n=1 Tax=Ambrosiozyma monospora TaxID=43982 RepID=A0A9W6Z8I7_AMBMO|nr:unnamed protein product [Ambrosiozyma monospora]
MKTSHILIILFHLFTIFLAYATGTPIDGIHLLEVTTNTSKSSSTSTSTSTSSIINPSSSKSAISTKSSYLTLTASSTSSSFYSSSSSSSDYNSTDAYKSFILSSKASVKSVYSVSTASAASVKSVSTESVAYEKSMSTKFVASVKSMSTKFVASVKSSSEASVKLAKSKSKESVEVLKTANKSVMLLMTITDPSDYTPTFNPVPSFSPTVSKLRTHSNKLTNHVIDHSRSTNDVSSKLSIADRSFISPSSSNLSAVETIPASSCITEETAAVNPLIGVETGSSSVIVSPTSGIPNQEDTSETQSKYECTSIIINTSVQSHIISSGTLTITYSATTFAAKRDEFGSNYHNIAADHIYVNPEESSDDNSVETQSKRISYAATVVVAHVSTSYHTDESQSSGTYIRF